MNNFLIVIFFSALITISFSSIHDVAAQTPSPGDIIVADASVDGIFIQKPGGGAPTLIFSGPPYLNPTGVTIDPTTGDIIVVDNVANAVFRQNPAGGAPTTIFSGLPYFSLRGVTVVQFLI